ncbi:S-adenosyl-L-methionine-dependent methyltransferase [Xylariales sp. AK1849]|nr:S-adenosyl-L-methionine-dependent methyltransferase [Xylariales sp. AK1849]
MSHVEHFVDDDQNYGNPGSLLVYPSQLLPSQTLPLEPLHQPQRTGSLGPVGERHVEGTASERGTPFLPSGNSSEPDTHQRSETSIVEPSSVIDMNGRTYQGYREGKYFLPNDPQEQDRLDFQHAAIGKLLDGKLSWAPMSSPPRNVLDVATGTGIWAMEFAEQNPTSTVIGSDLSLIQPTARVPKNCTFVREDAEEPWDIHPLGFFDYIHLRYVCTCFDNPTTVMKYAYDRLAPGGWIEYHDVAAAVVDADGTSIKVAWDLAIAGAAAAGRDIMVAHRYKEWLGQQGFVDIFEWETQMPVSAWPDDPKLKVVGNYMNRMLREHARGILYKLLESSGLPAEEIEDLITQCKEEFRSLNIPAYWPFYVVYARKPFDWELNDRHGN